MAESYFQWLGTKFRALTALKEGQQVLEQVTRIAGSTGDDNVNVNIAANASNLAQETGGNLAATATATAKGIPAAKAAVFNTALPSAEAALLASAITPTNSPSYLQVYVCVAVGGIFRVARTVSGVTVTENLNGGTALVADAAYLFTIPWRTGDSINFRYSETGAAIKRLLADEVAFG